MRLVPPAFSLRTTAYSVNEVGKGRGIKPLKSGFLGVPNKQALVEVSAPSFAQQG